MTTIKRIPVGALAVGMYIADIKNEWIPDQNMSRHGLVKNPKVIEHISRLGIHEVYIDISKGEACDVGEDQADIVAAQEQALADIVSKPFARPEPSTSFEQEFEAAKQIKKEATAMVTQVLSHVKLGKPVDFDAAEATADNILESLGNNQNALLCVSQIRTKDRYLLEHSFNVSVLMGVLASSLNYSDDELHELVSGALMHDIGKIRVDDAILHKPGSLTADEWEEMKRHVTYGEEELAKVPGVSQVVKDICAQHHERLDGTGYPRGLKEHQIPIHSRIASVVDVYDAITADRVYHNGMGPAKALKNMLEWSNEDHLDKQLVYQFIRCLSVYPAGSLVKLNNQRLAVVESVHATKMDKPTVQVVYDTKKRAPLSPYAIDLANASNDIVIEKAVDPQTVGLDVAKLIESI